MATTALDGLDWESKREFVEEMEKNLMEKQR
jgi:hypothetical protein